MSFFDRFRAKASHADDIKSIPSPDDPTRIVRVAWLITEGVVCWTCFEPLTSKPSVDVPLNMSGAWTRLHKKCVSKYAAQLADQATQKINEAVAKERTAREERDRAIMNALEKNKP